MVASGVKVYVMCRGNPITVGAKLRISDVIPMVNGTVPRNKMVVSCSKTKHGDTAANFFR